MKRGQVALEYLIIIGVVLAFLIPIVQQSFTTTKATIRLEKTQSSLQGLEDAINSVYVSGPGNKKTVKVYIPESTISSNVANNTIILTVNELGAESDILLITKTLLTGNLPQEPGEYKITVEALENGTVALNYVSSLQISPEYAEITVLPLIPKIYNFLLYNPSADQRAITNVTITGEIAPLVQVISFPETIAPGATETLTIEVLAPITAPPGQYSGEVYVTGNPDSLMANIAIIVLQTIGNISLQTTDPLRQPKSNFTQGELLAYNVNVLDQTGQPMLTNQIDVEILDPAGTLMYTVQNETIVYGVYENSYLISQTGTPGYWSITAIAHDANSNIQAMQTFYVNPAGSSNATLTCNDMYHYQALDFMGNDLLAAVQVSDDNRALIDRVRKEYTGLEIDHPNNYFAYFGVSTSLQPQMGAIDADICTVLEPQIFNNLSYYDLVILENPGLFDSERIQVENFVAMGGTIIMSSYLLQANMAPVLGIDYDGTGAQTASVLELMQPDQYFNFTVGSTYTAMRVAKVTDTYIPSNGTLDAQNFRQIARSQSGNDNLIARWNYGNGTVYYFSEFGNPGAEFREKTKNSILNILDRLYNNGKTRNMQAMFASQNQDLLVNLTLRVEHLESNAGVSLNAQVVNKTASCVLPGSTTETTAQCTLAGLTSQDLANLQLNLSFPTTIATKQSAQVDKVYIMACSQPLLLQNSDIQSIGISTNSDTYAVGGTVFYSLWTLDENEDLDDGNPILIEFKDPVGVIAHSKIVNTTNGQYSSSFTLPITAHVGK